MNWRTLKKKEKGATPGTKNGTKKPRTKKAHKKRLEAIQQLQHWQRSGAHQKKLGSDQQNRE